jgi:O-antigen ligase
LCFSDLVLDIHNVFIQIWYVGGLLAFAGFVGVYIWLGYWALRTLLNSQLLFKQKYVTTLASIVLAVILMDQFQDAIYQREKWLIFGLFAAIIWNTNNPLIRTRPGIYSRKGTETNSGQ